MNFWPRNPRTPPRRTLDECREILKIVNQNGRRRLWEKHGVPSYPPEVLELAAQTAFFADQHGGRFACIDAIEYTLTRWTDEDAAWERIICGVTA